MDPNNITCVAWQALHSEAVDRELAIGKKLAELEVKNEDLVETLKKYAFADEWQGDRLEDGTPVWYLKKQHVFPYEFAQDMLRKWGHL